MFLIIPLLDPKFVCKPGWIGFFWTLWLATKKGFDIGRHSLSVTGSAISSYSTARHAHRNEELGKKAD